MQSVLDVLKKTEAYFVKAGLETPKIEAERILAESLGLPRLQLYLEWERPLEEETLSMLRQRIQRRAAGEPLQYIIGHVDFHEIRLKVGPGVLIPRPETEQLVEHVIDRLSGVATPRIVDLGTGSGAIALALATALPQAKMLAIERSQDALEVARSNAEELGLRERVSFRSGDWLDGLAFEADCIVSNPPYLTAEEWVSARPEVREFEPKDALVAADNGLADLRKIVEGACSRLSEGGLLAMEMGIAHGETLVRLATDMGYQDVTVEQDFNGYDRFFFARRGNRSSSGK